MADALITHTPTEYANKLFVYYKCNQYDFCMLLVIKMNAKLFTSNHRFYADDT